MSKTLLAGLLALGFAAPELALAQRPAPEPSQAQPAPIARPAGWVIQPGQLVAVTAGVVVGAAAMEILVPTRLIYVLGAVAGGYLANTWYDGRRVEVHTVP